MHRRSSTRILLAMAAGWLACAAASERAQATILPTSDPLTLATAMEHVPGVVTGALFGALPSSGTPHGVGMLAGTATALAGFPTSGTEFAILTSGNASFADQPNVSDSTGANLGGGAVRGDTDRDVSVLRIDVDVPEGANCLSIDFRFLSDEFPEYVGSSVNDAFIAELDTSTWSTAGNVISAPNNFAFDPFGNVISINTAGPTSMTSDEAAGTTYDGATPLLTASTPVTSGAHSLYLSIFDQGDNIFDSAVFIDRLIVGTAAPGGCEPGARLCGNGLIDDGEQCDDGNSSDGDCCDSECQFEPGGSTCDDANACTQIDSCNGSGTCVGGAPLACSDGNACTTDSCDPVTGCLSDDAPATSCLDAPKSLLLIKDKADDSKDKLLWKWLKGAALTQPQLADPTDDTGYSLCVYAGAADTLIATATLPAGAGWSALSSKGYKFKGTSPQGLTNALLKGGSAGKSKAQAKGKGATLPDVSLPLEYPVTVQLRKDNAPLCLESTFSAPDVVKNDAAQFKAKK